MCLVVSQTLTSSVVWFVMVCVMFDVLGCLSDPDLIYEKCLERSEGFENAIDLFPSDYTTKVVRPELSGQ